MREAIYREIALAFKEVVKQGAYAHNGCACCYWKDGNSCVVGWWVRLNHPKVNVAEQENCGATVFFQQAELDVDRAEAHFLQATQTIHDQAYSIALARNPVWVPVPTWADFYAALRAVEQTMPRHAGKLREAMEQAQHEA